VYAWCRFQYDKTTVDSWLRRTEARKAREKREYEAMVAELEYRQKQIEPWLMKKAEQLTPKDWEEYLSLFKAPDPRVRREAMKRRMFVDVGRSHRAETHLRVAPAKRGSNAGQEAVEAP
jgi:pyrroloquinoline quinone (PQQ) biosynthesis protein C